jgi:type VI secretion system protein ImpL
MKPVSLDPGSTQFQLDLEGQKIVYAHGPTRRQPVRWPNPAGTRSVRLFFEDGQGQRKVTTADGPWAWFRILEATSPKRLSAERVSITFANAGHEARYEVIANSVINPFLMPELGRFRCPEGF